MKKILVLFLMCVVALGARAADLQKLVQDTQRLAQEPSSMLLVWWIPSEFWDEVLRNDPRITEDLRKQFEATLGAYMVFAVVAVDVGPMGGMTPRGREAIEAETVLTVAGAKVPLLAAREISPDALNFVSMMKPMMSNMLGQFGQGIEFLLYPNPPAEGAPKINAREEGQFSYSAFGHTFEWRLPLGSLLPPRIDPVSGETFPGDYRFNPYTGAKLEVAP